VEAAVDVDAVEEGSEEEAAEDERRAAVVGSGAGAALGLRCAGKEDAKWRRWRNSRITANATSI
jgi:hypothetical protein